METIEINSYLLTENLFELFKKQLKKDFEGSGLNSLFTEQLPSQFELLKKSISRELASPASSSLLPGLLYRVDISEALLKNYHQAHQDANFEDLVSELIIKRVLQKVILKKRFST